MIKKLFCSLVAFGCVAGAMSGDDVNAMDDKNKAEDLAREEHMSRCGLEALPTRLSVLIVSTPKEWTKSFRFIDKNVSDLLANDNISVFSNLSRVAISLSYPETLKSLCDFCAGSEFDDRSQHTLCGLLTLFSRLAIKLDEPCSGALSSALALLAKDPSKMENHASMSTHPIRVLAIELSKRYRELPED